MAINSKGCGKAMYVRVLGIRSVQKLERKSHLSCSSVLFPIASTQLPTVGAEKILGHWISLLNAIEIIEWKAI